MEEKVGYCGDIQIAWIILLSLHSCSVHSTKPFSSLNGHGQSIKLKLRPKCYVIKN